MDHGERTTLTEMNTINKLWYGHQRNIPLTSKKGKKSKERLAALASFAFFFLPTFWTVSRADGRAVSNRDRFFVKKKEVAA